MKSYELNTFDSAKYEFLSEDVSSGSRPRILVRHRENRQKSLIKTYKRTPRELWAEVLASKIGKMLNFDVQLASLRRADDTLDMRMKADYGREIPDDWDRFVAQISYLLPRGWTFNFGSQYIKRSKEQSELFSLNEVEEAFRKSFPTTNDLIYSFSKMVIFDFLIGNSDRHRDNWAIAINEKYPKQMHLFRLSAQHKAEYERLRHFATLFDHGDSFLYELEEHHLDQMQKNEQKRAEYILSKETSYLCLESGDKACLYDVIKEKTNKPVHPEDKWRKVLRKVIKELLDCVNIYEIAKTIAQMPGDEALCYTSIRKDVLLQTTTMRINLLRKLVV